MRKTSKIWIWLFCLTLVLSMSSPVTVSAAGTERSEIESERVEIKGAGLDSEQLKALESSQDPEGSTAPEVKPESPEPEADGTESEEAGSKPETSNMGSETAGPEEEETSPAVPAETEVFEMATELPETEAVQDILLFQGADSPEAMVQAYVIRLYEKVLGRSPDVSGLRSWTELLLGGQSTGADVAAGFVFSDEYQRKSMGDGDFVEMLYQTMLNRASDAGGKAAWTRLLSCGVSRNGVFAGFANSREFQEICDTYQILRGEYRSDKIEDQNGNVTAFVSRMYTVALGRSFDRDGLRFWTERLLAHEIGGGELIQGFFFSREFLNKNLSDTDFVTVCYRTCLDREPDQGGLNSWVNLLQAGKSRAGVLNGFIGSAEYGKLCEEYGIARGNLIPDTGEQQSKVAEIARNNKGTVAASHGKCAAWVSGVYQAAGLGYPGGNASDYWEKWKDSGSSDLSCIPVGAAVVGSGSTNSSGLAYGHIGIYIGDGKIAHNVGGGCATISTVEEFASIYCKGNLSRCDYEEYRGAQGILGWVWPNGQGLH